MKQNVRISKDRFQQIVKQEVIAHRFALREAAADAQTEEKKSHEISAAADTLADAIKAFDEAGLPDVPAELKSALDRAKSILVNMSDNPGQYKGGSGRKRPDVKESDY